MYGSECAQIQRATTRAVLLKGERNLALTRIDEPPAPTPDEIKVQIRTVALNHIDVWSWRGMAFAKRDFPIVLGAAVRDNVTPMEGVLACFGDWVAATGKPPVVVGVGDVKDYTGKYSINEGNAITQGGALMVYSALGKLGGAVAVALEVGVLRRGRDAAAGLAQGRQHLIGADADGRDDAQSGHDNAAHQVFPSPGGRSFSPGPGRRTGRPSGPWLHRWAFHRPAEDRRPRP